MVVEAYQTLFSSEFSRLICSLAFKSLETEYHSHPKKFLYSIVYLYGDSVSDLSLIYFPIVNIKTGIAKSESQFHYLKMFPIISLFFFLQYSIRQYCCHIYISFTELYHYSSTLLILHMELDYTQFPR